jgi:hypothetical protein
VFKNGRNGQARLGAFAKLRKATISFVMSVRLSIRPHRTPRLPLDGFSWNFLFEYFSKICWQNSSVIKMWQEQRAVYTKTYAHSSQYLAELFLELEMLQIKVIQKIKTHVLCSITFFGKLCRLWENLEKYGTARQVTDDTIIRRTRIEC